MDLPENTTYYVGDGEDNKAILDTKGMSVKAIYVGEDSDSERIELDDENLKIGSVDTETAGQKNVGITYNGVSTEITVNVEDVKPKSAKIDIYPKTTYEIGESFDSEGIEVSLVYNNGNEVILTEDTDFTVNTSNIDNTKVGNYQTSIKISDSYGLTEDTIPFSVTYRESFVPEFKSVIFGASTSLTSQSDGINNDCVVEPSGDILNDGSVRVASLNGKGKVTGAQDGIAYYYFELDPAEDNFKISADVTVNSYAKNPHDGQESFGIMARDAINTNGDSAVFASNIASVGGYSGSTRTSNGIQGFVRTGVDPDDEQSTIEMEVSPVEYMDAKDMNGQTYRLSLEKDNSGFLMSFDDNEPVRIYADEDLLAKTTKDTMYVGFYAGRVADITVSNVDLEVSDKESDKEGVLRPQEAIEPTVNITSLDKFGSSEYEFRFTPNTKAR